MGEQFIRFCPVRVRPPDIALTALLPSSMTFRHSLAEQLQEEEGNSGNRIRHLDNSIYRVEYQAAAGMYAVRRYGIRDASLGLADVELVTFSWSCNCRYARWDSISADVESNSA
ncbi:hypothetical protein Nepgr_031281 [Nepenthes gracilis]|uniref:Uncharacterized protein n=1 Tax=Nepenthes gracilis TaxID=150966 RepID=A0AAD3TI60_NEPGR|nr:hypothetical protein Nepgr_031281 [Nepenthes gracilis]